MDRRSTFPSNDPTYNNHVKTLSAAYSTFFTIILIFGSFVLVFEEYYNTDGEYLSPWRRLFCINNSPIVLSKIFKNECHHIITVNVPIVQCSLIIMDLYTIYICAASNLFSLIGYFTLGGKLASSLYRAIVDTALGIIAGIIILSILLAKNVVGNSTAALQLAAVRTCSM